MFGFFFLRKIRLIKKISADVGKIPKKFWKLNKKVEKSSVIVQELLRTRHVFEKMYCTNNLENWLYLDQRKAATVKVTVV